jgi:hydantoinase/carbamoylase family amidase
LRLINVPGQAGTALVPELLPQIDAEQLTQDLADLAEFSAPGPGVTRLAWTPENLRASRWLVQRMQEEGLDATIDPAGNVIGKLGADEDAGAILIGSHIDTVPAGGRFDGALGVLAGLAVIRVLRAERDRLRRPIWLAAFMDEEGVRFGTSFFGSRAFAGDSLPELSSEDSSGVTLRQAIEAAGLKPERAPSAAAIADVSAYLELHIEQGPRLEEAGECLGVVTDIVGRSILSVGVKGEANHAGTTPPERRRDALLAAADLVVRVHESFARFGEASVNIGQIEVVPGAVNVVPGGATLEVEIRAATLGLLQGGEKLLSECAKAVETRRRVTVHHERRDQVKPTSFDPDLVALLGRAAAAQGVPAMPIVSGAGHDAMVMAGHVPTAMLMVPSQAGVSHSPAEFTAPDLCARGAATLALAVSELALDQGDPG